MPMAALVPFTVIAHIPSMTSFIVLTRIIGSMVMTSNAMLTMGMRMIFGHLAITHARSVLLRTRLRCLLCVHALVIVPALCTARLRLLLTLLLLLPLWLHFRLLLRTLLRHTRTRTRARTRTPDRTSVLVRIRVQRLAIVL